jgi:uncharacterized lipoprotein YddW (UPF0748 family)
MRIPASLRPLIASPKARFLGLAILALVRFRVAIATQTGDRGVLTESASEGEPAETADAPAGDGTEAAPRVPAQPQQEERRTADPAPKEIRGAWVQAFNPELKSPGAVAALVEEVRNAGVNTLIVQVVRRQDAFYDSSVLPRSPDPELEPGFDALAEVVRLAEPHGIDVEAWIVVAPAYSEVYDRLTPPEGWVWTEHGRNAPESQRWVTRSNVGTWSEYLDLGVPAVQDHVTAVATEIAQKYDVAAVHLDYIRYPASEFGYHPVALERFREETGRTGTPDPSDAEWSDWRRGQVTALVERIRDSIDEVSPGTRLTAATIAWGNGPGAPDEFRNTSTYRDTLQDWATWAREGTVDAIYPMVYFRDPEHASSFQRWTAFSATLAAETDTPIAVGVGAWLNSPSTVTDQLRQAAEVTDGSVVYSWQEPTSGSRSETIAGIAQLWAEPPE